MMRPYKLVAFRQVIKTRIKLGTILLFRPEGVLSSFDSYLFELRIWNEANRKILKAYSAISDKINTDLYAPITLKPKSVDEIKEIISEKIEELAFIANSYDVEGLSHKKCVSGIKM